MPVMCLEHQQRGALSDLTCEWCLLPKKGDKPLANLLWGYPVARMTIITFHQTSGCSRCSLSMGLDVRPRWNKWQTFELFQWQHGHDLKALQGGGLAQRL